MIAPPDGAPLSVWLADQIVELIVAEELKPGSRLPSERELAVRYGVSRTVVRDATAGLEQRGVVAARPGSGTFVRDGSRAAMGDVLDSMLRQDNTSLIELLEARHLIEVHNAANAARRAPAESLAEMAAAIERMRASRGPLELAEADADFHAAVASAGGNRVLAAVLGGLRHMLVEGMVIGLRAPGARESAIREHMAILDAARSQDHVLARQRMTKHLDDSYDEWTRAGFLPRTSRPSAKTTV